MDFYFSKLINIRFSFLFSSTLKSKIVRLSKIMLIFFVFNILYLFKILFILSLSLLHLLYLRFSYFFLFFIFYFLYFWELYFTFADSIMAISASTFLPAFIVQKVSRILNVFFWKIKNGEGGQWMLTLFLLLSIFFIFYISNIFNIVLFLFSIFSKSSILLSLTQLWPFRLQLSLPALIVRKSQ